MFLKRLYFKIASLTSIRDIIKNLVEDGYLESKLVNKEYQLLSRFYLSGDIVNNIVIPTANESDIYGNDILKEINPTEITTLISNLENKITTLTFGLEILLRLISLGIILISFTSTYLTNPVVNVLDYLHIIPDSKYAGSDMFTFLTNGITGALISAYFYQFRRVLSRFVSKRMLGLFMH